MNTTTTRAEKTADSATVVYEFAKSTREKIRASLKRYSGRDYVDIRTYYEAETDSPDVELAPSKKGITVRLDLLPELQKAVKALAAAAGEQGLT